MIVIQYEYFSSELLQLLLLTAASPSTGSLSPHPATDPGRRNYLSVPMVGEISVATREVTVGRTQ
jgi:hypothetical protein